MDDSDSFDSDSEEIFSKPVDRQSFLKVTGGLVAGAALSGSLGASRAFARSSLAESAGVLNKIFGPGGKAAGQGVVIDHAVSASMTGPAAVFGKWQVQGITLAAKQIEHAGGPTFKIHVADHVSGSVGPGVSNFRQVLSQDKISTASISFGDIADALVPLVEQNKILALHGGGPSPFALFKDYVWNTRDVFAWDYLPPAAYWLAKAYPNAKRLALVVQLENGIEAMHQLAPQVWEHQIGGGRKIVASETYNVGESDYSTLIARLKSASPDAIITSAFGPDVGTQTNQFRAGGLTVPLVAFDGLKANVIGAGSALDTLHISWDGYLPNPPNPFARYLVQTFTKAYGSAPGFYSVNYYNDMFRLWEIVRHTIKAGGDPTSGTDLQKALKANPTQVSAYGGTAKRVGHTKFHLDSHIVDLPVGVYALSKQGQPKLVYNGTSKIPSRAPLKRLKK